MNMKPMILDKEQQISFISMCNNAMDNGHKHRKFERHKKKASKRTTRSNGHTEKQIIMVNELEKGKAKWKWRKREKKKDPKPTR